MFNYLKLVFWVLVIVASEQLFSQQLKYIRKSNPQISSFIGYVDNEIIIEVTNSTFKQMDIRNSKVGIECSILELDSLSEIYKVSKMIQQFPNIKPKMYKGKVIDLENIFRLVFKEAVDIDSTLNEYSKLSSIVSVQPIGIHSISAQYPNDGFFSNQWHLNQSLDHDVDAPEAWDTATGDSYILIAMLDTGVRYYHKDLGGVNASSSNRDLARGNMWINNDELNGTSSFDDDGNGYTDDWIGWDFVTGVTLSYPYSSISGEDYSTADNDPADFNGHGTHCTGNISAINNNGYASSSVSGGWGNGSLQEYGNGVKVIALRIGYSADHAIYGEVGLVRMDFAASALVYAADIGAHIASCSWGSSNSGGLGAAIDYFLASGGLIFKAAGNDGLDNPDYMANRSDDNIIDVASTDSSDVKSDFSNFGTWVDISAPGSDIVSSYHVHSDPTNDYVATLDGTSMATPIAASVAALIWSANNSLTNDQVRNLLYNNSDDIESLNPTHTGQLGVGRVNAYNVMQDPSLPVTLAAFVAKGSKDGVLLNWVTESEIENLGFVLERKTGNESNWQFLDDYKTSDVLKGQGNSSSVTTYKYIDNNVEVDNIYEYRIADVSYNGTKTYLEILKIEYDVELLTDQFLLYNAFPNPFNPITRIRYNLPNNCRVNLSVFDTKGQKIKSLLYGIQEAGSYEIQWDGTNEENKNVSSGMYLYKIVTRDFTQVKKILLVR